jgi:sucrose-6-phosphate hydrolase SacC (GH32 family)
VPCCNAAADEQFPPELVAFEPYQGNPVFAGTGKDTWDRTIRERGYILREGDTWHLWYTGHNHNRSDANYRNTMSLGYATSPDGLQWTRHGDNPVFDKSWTEDMMVVKHGDTYYMFAEGLHDIAHMLTSTDRVHWRDHGRLDVRQTNGKPLGPGPYGTPTVWVQRGRWYLFYERRYLGSRLATSADCKVWTNVQDDPVIPLGPKAYDKGAVAMNQVVKHRDRYYAYYHANADPKWHGPWTTNVAVSEDLIHWKKYAKNPIIPTNHSSGTLVHDGRQYRLYTTHPDVRVYLPKSPKTR